ncbi:MAG: imidazole glycerol phosphate synthase subunit HisH [Solirubrobacteraceae bacterium]|nr:imidazole glycerol phosphate synthase subunit HisH [Solirubrobacteraceae bacterium]
MSDAGARIAVVDYGVGNRRSVEKALARVGADTVVTADPEELRAADGLVLPGVGAFPAGMRMLVAAGLDELLRERAAAAVPIFGACLGMQLLFEHSAEHGGCDGLGLLRGDVRPLRAPGMKLPHIGWSEVRWQAPSPLTAGLPDPSVFYHVHSYAPHPADEADVIGVSEYGEPFASVVGHGLVFGAQFHPEKSSAHGIELLRGFVALTRNTTPSPT